VQDVFPSAELLNLLGTDKFDIITSIAMFYDLEDPVHFTRGIRDVLAPDGLWIFEMSYMPSMLETNSYDTICHEHLEYYSLAVIENILRRADLKAVRATFNSINGGSIRVYATHAANFKFKNPAYAEELRKLRQQESIKASIVLMGTALCKGLLISAFRVSCSTNFAPYTARLCRCQATAGIR